MENNDWQILRNGDRVRIENPVSSFHGRRGRIDRIYHSGAIIVKLWGEARTLPFGISELRKD